MNYIIEEVLRIAADVTSTDPSVRKRAELSVKQYEDTVDQQSGFVTALLQVSSDRSPASSFASIQLKNTIKKCWNEKNSEHCITEEEKSVIRENIIPVAIQAPAVVQSNLSEAVSLIAASDFPTSWPGAISQVATVLLSNQSIAESSAALLLAHSILVKYREADGSGESGNFFEVLKVVYSTLSEPLIVVMESLISVAETSTGQDAIVACKGLTAGVQCLRDISSVDLGDEFINALSRVVNVFLRSFRLQNAVFQSNLDDVFELKSSVTSCVTHFLTSFDEDFEEYAGGFLQEVLVMISNNVEDEMANDLIIKGIHLLATACRGSCRSFFDNDELLSSLSERIITPCLMIQSDFVDAYSSDPHVYVLYDIEGSDQHTRRRSICDLIRALLSYFPDRTRPLFSSLVKHLFDNGAGNWRAKNAAIFLASNLCLSGSSSDAQRGVTKGQVDPLVPLEDFLRGFILPEIESPVSESSPLLIKADCLRVLTAFRNFLDGNTIEKLLGLFPGFLSCKDYVVQTYTANALHRFLQPNPHSNTSLVTEGMFSTHAGPLLASVCQCITADDEQNPYYMQCLMTVCSTMHHCVAPFVGDIVLTVNQSLTTASRNPSNPLFSHCLFETLSTSIANFSVHASSIEQTVWPNLMYVLANDVAEYVPYVLQIISQLLLAYPKDRCEPPDHYKDLLEPLTQIEFYSPHTGNIPAATCLLVSFIERYPTYVHQHPGELTQKILNIFLGLIQYKQYDHDGLSILTAMILYYPREVMDLYFTTALQCLLKRLQTKKTPKFARIFILFLSLTVVVRGTMDTVSRLEAIQPGLFFMILERVWLADINKISGELERKVCVISLTKLLTECTELQSNELAWSSTVFSCLKVLHTGVEKDDHKSFVPPAPVSFLGVTAPKEGFNSLFCPLKEAVHPPVDVCADIPDADNYFRTQMTNFLKGNGGALLPILKEKLTPEQLSVVFYGN